VFSLSQRLARVAASGAAAFALATASLGAQGRPTVGVFGGASFPTGDLAKNFDTGYDVGAFIGFKPSLSPVGLRIEGAYNRFDISGGADVHVNILSGTANIVLQGSGMPGAVRPYFIGGIGVYGSKDVVQGQSSASDTKFGVNGGAGLDIGLSGLGVFIEARYHYVFNKDNEVANSSNTAFVPVVVGVRF